MPSVMRKIFCPEAERSTLTLGAAVAAGVRVLRQRHRRRQTHHRGQHRALHLSPDVLAGAPGAGFGSPRCCCFCMRYRRFCSRSIPVRASAMYVSAGSSLVSR